MCAVALDAVVLKEESSDTVLYLMVENCGDKTGTFKPISYYNSVCSRIVLYNTILLHTLLAVLKSILASAAL